MFPRINVEVELEYDSNTIKVNFVANPTGSRIYFTFHFLLLLNSIKTLYINWDLLIWLQTSIFKKMPRIVLVLILSFYTISSFGQTSNVLTNAEVIKLHNSKVGDKIIISKIESSDVNFDISTDALVQLSQLGVSEAVVNVMMEKQTAKDKASNNLVKSSGISDGFAFPRSGIYFENEKKKYVPLDPTLVTSTKSDGNCLINCLMSYGLASKKNFSYIEGYEANYHLGRNPTIYFCFSDGKKDLNKAKSNQDDDYFGQLIGNQTAVSPNEFKLIKFKIKGKSRSYVSGSVKGNTLTADVSIADEYLINFKYVQVAENTYKLIFPNGLEPGEYCFYYLSNQGTNPYAGSGYNNIKVYDFGVR